MIPGIHQAAAIEIPLIQSLIHQIWKPTYREILSEEQMDYMLERMYAPDILQQQMDEGHIFLIITEDDTPVGFAGFECNYGGREGVCKLHKIYLLPETQGKGLGKMLLHAVKEKALERSQQQLLLNVNRYNKALHFYRRQGFEVIAEEDIDIGQGFYMNDYLMSIMLKKKLPGQ